MEHGDDPALADTSAPLTTDLVGTLALAGFLSANSNVTRKLGYMGSKRFLRLTVTPTSNTGNLFVAGVAVLGQPRGTPAANPPQ
jgi:hypothetical protein